MVRNPEGIWINTECFSEEAKHFQKYGYYTDARWGSTDWKIYWSTILDRWINGYSVGGVRITGPHYMYLNFAPIQRKDEKKNRKIRDFPDFWDYDYNYFHILEIARDGCTPEELKKLQLEVTPIDLSGGNHVIVAKKRRWGASFKNGLLAAHAFNTVRESLTLINVYDKKYLYPKGTMAMVATFLDFINANTGLAKKREYSDTQLHKRASFKEMINGINVERGYKSDIMGLTFMDNPDAARGKDAYLVLWEEAGAFDNLEASYLATKDALEDGAYTTGLQIIFGTSGDLDKGSVDFAKMFYNPLPYKLLPFENIWDEGAEGTKCGFFVPDYVNKVGYIDKAGNSDKEGARESEQIFRDALKNQPGGISLLEKRVQEHPFTPSEAFMQAGENPFPVEMLTGVRNKLVREERFRAEGKPAILYYLEGKPAYKIDLNGITNPLYRYPPEKKTTSSGFIMYEAPVFDPPWGLYKIGLDPLQQDQGTSLLSFLVYKTSFIYSDTHDTIVGEYTGREDDPESMNIMLEIATLLYNAEVMHENMTRDVYNYFWRRKLLKYLAGQPDATIAQSIEASKTRRKYGTHMTPALFNDGLKYIISWLLTERESREDGTKVFQAETIKSIGLLDEMIAYKKGKNVDRIVAFMMIMFALEEIKLTSSNTNEEAVDQLREYYEKRLKHERQRPKAVQAGSLVQYFIDD